MTYPELLARRVLGKNPSSPEESRKALKETLREEGYKDGDPEAISLRIEVAKAAREILQKRVRRVS